MCFHVKNILLWLLLASLTLLAAGTSPLLAQPAKSEIKTGAFSAVGGQTASANCATYFIANQASPTEISQSANFGEIGGLLAFLSIPKISGRVSANVNCLATFAKDCSTQVSLNLDLSGTIPAAQLESHAGRLLWAPTLLKFVRHSGLLSGFIGVVNTDSVGFGVLTFNGANTAGGKGLVELLTTDFEVIGEVAANGVLATSFSAVLSARPSQNLLPLLALNACAFSIKPAALLGDLNADGVVNSSDALIVLTYDAQHPIPPEILDRINAGVGDANQDGATNSTDALIILSFEMGKPVPFAVGQRLCP